MKIGLLLTSASLLLFSCKKSNEEHQTSNSDTNLEIIAEVKGLRKGELYLQKFQENSWVTLDTLRLETDTHKYKTHLHIPEPEILALSVNRINSNSNDYSIMFFAEPGTIQIKTTINRFFADAVISGSENQKVFEDYQKEKTKYTNISTEYMSKMIIAKKNSDDFVYASYEKDLKKNEQKRIAKALQFIIKNTDKEVAPYIAITDILPTHMQYADTIYKILSPKIQKSKYGEILKEVNENFLSEK